MLDVNQRKMVLYFVKIKLPGLFLVGLTQNTELRTFPKVVKTVLNQ